MKKIVLCIITTLVMLCSCSSSETHLSELKFNQETELICDLNGKVFTGIALSNDGKFAKFEIKDGQFCKAWFYHSNGAVAYHYEHVDGNDIETYYDEDNCLIKKTDFYVLYPAFKAKEAGLDEQLNNMYRNSVGQ